MKVVLQNGLMVGAVLIGDTDLEVHMRRHCSACLTLTDEHILIGSHAS